MLPPLQPPCGFHPRGKPRGLHPGDDENSFYNFELKPDFLNYSYQWSAGNGVLSRSVPLLYPFCDLSWIEGYEKWLSLTHLHPDGFDAVREMIDYSKHKQLPSECIRISSDAKGFYAPETLRIAISAVENSYGLREVFLKSQVPNGDNDSTAALAFALWYLKTGEELDEHIFNRFSEGDKKTLKVWNGFSSRK